VVAELAGPIAAGEQTWADRVISTAGKGVVYHGTLSGADLTAWLDRLDAVVIPSRWLETGPLTLLEAWDRGVPVIGANAGGIRDFLIANDLTELAFPVGNVAGLVAAVQRVLEWTQPPPTVTIPGVADLAQRMSKLYAASVNRKKIVS
jgi:glycosyltransferase involved in cell wall biosynthesis